MIELSIPKFQGEDDFEEEILQMTQFKQFVNKWDPRGVFSEHSSYITSKDRSSNYARQLYSLAEESINNKKLKLLKAQGVLPKSALFSSSEGKKVGDGVLTQSEAINKIAMSPTVRLSSIREVADKIGFIVLPFEYMNEQAWSQDRAAQNKIRAFTKSSGARELGYIPYVLTPVLYYDVYKQISNRHPDLSIYTGTHSTNLMSLQMMIPTLVTLYQDISNLKEQSNEQHSRLKKVEENISSMSKQLEMLQNQIQEQNKKIIEQQEESRSLLNRVRELESGQWSLSIIDPMLFLIPERTDVIRDDCFAKIGPCWGPDFDDILAGALGYTPNPEQRMLIEDQIDQIWDPNAYRQKLNERAYKEAREQEKRTWDAMTEKEKQEYHKLQSLRFLARGR